MTAAYGVVPVERLLRRPQICHCRLSPWTSVHLISGNPKTVTKHNVSGMYEDHQQML